MFLLKTPKEPRSQVWLIYSCADKRLRMSMGIIVDVDNWSADTRRIIGRDSNNKLLNRVETYIISLEETRKATGQPILAHKLRAEVHAMMGHIDRRPAKMDFMPYLGKFITDRTEGHVLTKRQKRFAYQTLKHYRHTETYLLRYEADTGERITFAGVDLAFRDRFISWCQQPGRNLATNSIGVFIKNIKVVMDAAYNEGLHKNTGYKHKDFTVPKEETPDIYLTEAELQAMEQCPTASDSEAIARDWFLIEAYTGLRVSDALRLQPGHIADGRISISNEKTDDKVVLPIHPTVQRILMRRQGMPPRMSEQKINKHIKELGKKAGITQLVLYTVTKGGRRVDEYLPKYAMISHHTGRRSFITNLVRQGVNYQIIMKLAGIRKANTLERYNKLSVEETADIAAGLPFFT